MAEDSWLDFIEEQLRRRDAKLSELNELFQKPIIDNNKNAELQTQIGKKLDNIGAKLDKFGATLDALIKILKKKIMPADEDRIEADKAPILNTPDSTWKTWGETVIEVTTEEAMKAEKYKHDCVEGHHQEVECQVFDQIPHRKVDDLEKLNEEVIEFSVMTEKADHTQKLYTQMRLWEFPDEYVIEPTDESSGSCLAINRVDGSVKLLDDIPHCSFLRVPKIRTIFGVVTWEEDQKIDKAWDEEITKFKGGTLCDQYGDWKRILVHATFSKLSFSIPETENPLNCGGLESYDRSYDRVTPRNKRCLERFKNRNIFKITTTDDLAKEDKAKVFATDTILSTLMCAPRSIYAWDIIIQRVGILYSGSGDGTALLWSLSDHNPLVTPGEDRPGNWNSVLSLAMQGNLLLAGHENGYATIWKDGILLKSSKVRGGAVFSISKNGKWLFTGGWDKTINIQELSGDGSQVEAIPIGSVIIKGHATSVLTIIHHIAGMIFAKRQIHKSTSGCCFQQLWCLLFQHFDVLLDSLISTAKISSQAGGVANQALISVAQCVEVLCLAAGQEKCSSTVNMLTEILKDDRNANLAKKHLALLCLDEIGRRKDLSTIAQIENIIIESFQASFEEIKSTTSYALGNITVESLLFELRKVEEMKQQCDEKMYIYENMVAQRADKEKSRSGKGESIYSQQIQTAREEYDEVARLCVFRVESLKQGQCRSLLTQAARHHAAQLTFFRRELKSLEAVEPYMRNVAQNQYIDYQPSKFDEAENLQDSGNSDDTYYDEELSFDNMQNKQDNENAGISRNSMELENFGKKKREQIFSRKPRVSSHSAPIYADKFNPSGKMREMQTFI